MEADRLVDVEWNVKERHTYPVHIRVVCRDRKGVLADVSSAISAHDVNISNAQVDTNNPDMQAVCDFKIERQRPERTQQGGDVHQEAGLRDVGGAPPAAVTGH